MRPPAGLRDPGRRGESRRDHLELRQLYYSDNQFLIVAFCIFMVVRALNKMKRPSPTAARFQKIARIVAMTIPIKATRCPHCTTEFSRA